MVQEANLALQRKRASNTAFTAITYVPIRPHIIRQSDGTGGFSLANLNQAIALTNNYYLLNGFGIQFYFAGTTPDYIDNDDMYQTYGNQSVDAYDSPNALNQYYVNRFLQPGLNGLAYYPDNYIYSTRSFILAGEYTDADYVGNFVIPHELGHNFSLIHTFGNSNGTSFTNELVTRGAGANCSSAGDLICDTPADPFTNSSNLTINVNGCPQYNSDNSIRDANGDAFTPLVTNIMSYYFACTHDFTPGQYDRMQAGLALRQTHTAYTLDFPATDVAPVTNLAAASNNVSVLLTWKDNANNEMGYFIERSTSPTTGFVSIGGVATNQTAFRDNQAAPQTAYYYRIRPSNTTTGSISSVISIITPVVPAITGLTTTGILGDYARLSWNSIGEGAQYEVQWRPQGAATWMTQGTTPEPYTGLGGLSTNTAYEWQVRAVGSASYSGPVSFTTGCPTPSSPASSPTRISASLSWNGVSNQAYTLQWRPSGATNWTTISNLTGTTFNSTTSYSLTGLSSQTAYEWQVQAVCPGSPPIGSDYTTPHSFTTGACNPPSFTSANNPGAELVSFSWSTIGSGEPGSSAELRYRPVGTTNWITVSGIPNELYNGSSYTVTAGLTNNTTYEWQVKNICGAVESSPYTTLSTFTTTCRTPTGLSNIPTSRGAILQWGVSASPDPATTYTVQYRPVGSPTWTTMAGLSSSSYSLTGLVAGTTYEWHVLTTCTANTASNYSVTKTFTTGCNQLVANNLKSLLITSTSVQLVWTISNDPDTQYNISYRPIGTPNWYTINGLTASSTGGFYNLLGLTNNTTYEWQISTLCSDTQVGAFTAGPNFTTQCQTPINLSAIARFSSVLLSWKQMGLEVTYDVNYRRVGQQDFTTLSNLTTTSLVVTGLISSTQYEWQVRAHCSDGQTGDFSINQTYFTTNACSQPYPAYPAVTNLTNTSAIVNWLFAFSEPNTPGEVRYRVAGTTTWTTLTNLSTANYAGNVSITGLTPNTSYEWQVKSLCYPSINSAFSTSYFFQTHPLCSSMYTIQTGAWNDPMIWSCNRIPTNTDVVWIKHIVTIPASYIANARQVGFESGQKLSFGTSAQLKLGL
ncbi:hypothetical protein GCM10028808_03180 [Spirosoma migulaei]